MRSKGFLESILFPSHCRSAVSVRTMAPVYPSNGHCFGDLELIMDHNVHRVLSPQFRRSLLPPPTPPPLQSNAHLQTPAESRAKIPSGDSRCPKSAPGPKSKPNPMPTAASISLALGSVLSSNLLLSKAGLLAPPSTTSKPLPAIAGRVGTKAVSSLPSQKKCISPVPIQSSLALEIPSPAPRPSRTSAKFTSAFPDYLHLRHNGRGAGDPINGAAMRKASIVWFRNDLRVHDNEALSAANKESVSVLPVYCFDPRDYGKSSSGFDKTGPYRATFLLECVANLRASLRERGSDLVVRVGKPEDVLADLAKTVGADALYAHQEVSHDEIRAEEKIKAALKDEGVETKFFWGSTLYHIDDLPFKLEDMPSNYGGFREKVQRLGVRQTIQAPEQLKGLPARGNVDPGEIPSLLDLGLNPKFAAGQDGKTAANASLIGGEAEALERLKRFATECREQPNKMGKDGCGDNLYGANFSCKISPWLAMGCLSPRYMFEELKKNGKRSILSSVAKNSDGAADDGGLNWLIFELLWRDFFRFITKKYSSNKKRQDAVPATACMGAIAM